ncbi:MAG TPA: glycosyltransferase family 39 protein [Steroidobacteraceae bacterium]|jgi:4-amino-4-deoxy-L-arabinose transferase-like glycosyltransferase|nr:glycosyltransferase family 39 protein [Steroidobacteraceae bacterium]
MSESSALAPHERWTYAAVAALLALVWLAASGARPLFNPDEGRYAEIPREMLSGGDWVIPHLNGLAYLEKPPLQYWATAISYRLLGVSELSARLYSALTAFGTLLCTALIASAGEGARAAIGARTDAQGGARAGWRAAAVLGGMLMFVALGQILTLDMSLAFYMTLSLAAFLQAQRRPRYRAWMLLAWAAAGCAVLTKGVVAAAIPAAVLVIYSVWSRDFAPWRRLNLAWGLPLFAVIAVPWHWLAAHRDPGFLQFFFIHEHLARYLTPSADRAEPWWFFGGVFLAGSFPWTLPALRALASGWRREAPGFDAGRFLWIWLLFVIAFFSLSDSKLMPYILPGMPALAVLIARLPPKALERDMRVSALLTAVAGIALALASLEWTHVVAFSSRSAYFTPLAQPLLRVALLLFVSGAFVLVRARDATRAAIFLGLGWALSWLLVVRAASVLSPVYSGVDLARALPSTLGARVPVYSVATYDQSLTFYLRRPVTLVAYRGELDYGLQRDPSAEITQDAFRRLWSAQPMGYAIMEKGMFQDLSNAGAPMRVLASTERRVLVARQ